jgi:hypothetical protein
VVLALPSMNLPLIIALAVLILAGVGLALWFHRATRRTRQVLQAARVEHRLVLDRVREAESPVDWDPLGEDGDGWATLGGTLDGARFELGASRGLGGDTKFIDLVTRLVIQVPGLATQQRVRLPEDAPALRTLGLENELVAALSALAYEVRLEPGRVRLAARPTGPTVHRYSYGVRLTLDHELLLQVLALALEAGRLLKPEATA